MQERRFPIFVFDMNDYPNPQFLTSGGFLTSEFTRDCYFFSSKEALRVSQIAQSKYPKANFQLDIIRHEFPFPKMEAKVFWRVKLWLDFRAGGASQLIKPLKNWKRIKKK